MASNTMKTGIFTTEFHQEFATETGRLLRQRFFWFSGVVMVLYVLMFLASVVTAVSESAPAPTPAATANEVQPAVTAPVVEAPVSDAPAEPATGALPTPAKPPAAKPSSVGKRIQDRVDKMVGATRSPAGWFITFLSIVNISAGFFYVWRYKPPPERVLPLSIAIVLIDASLNLAMHYTPDQASGARFFAMVTHILAASFLPWTWRQALWAILPALIVDCTLRLFVPDGSAKPSGISDGSAFLINFFWQVVILVIIPLPGTTICWFRHSMRMEKFRLSFVENRYGQIRRELTDARKIHESLFPPPDSRGTIQFSYRYEPMRLIGGDYLYARFTQTQGDDEPSLSLLLLDVTGHGVAAALTVNRLYGEVERLFAENPDIGPGEVIRALNRYVHLTLAQHEVFVTGMCIRIDPTTDMLHYASAGHPPAFLRGVDGTLEQLGSTTYLLGAVPDSDFDPAPEPRRFGRGDALIAYTDGAMETRDQKGRMLGVDGLQRALASCGPMSAGDWSSYLITAVDRHRHGPLCDDTLVVEVSRLIVAAPAVREQEPATKIMSPKTRTAEAR